MANFLLSLLCADPDQLNERGPACLEIGDKAVMGGLGDVYNDAT